MTEFKKGDRVISNLDNLGTVVSDVYVTEPSGAEAVDVLFDSETAYGGRTIGKLISNLTKIGEVQS